MTNIQKTIKCVAFMVMLAALSGIVLLGFPTAGKCSEASCSILSSWWRIVSTILSSWRRIVINHTGPAMMVVVVIAAMDILMVVGYSSYRGGGHGLWWVPLAIVGGAVAVLSNSVAVLSNSVAGLSNYNSPYYAPYYAAPPVYVQPAPSVPPSKLCLSIPGRAGANSNMLKIVTIFKLLSPYSGPLNNVFERFRLFKAQRIFLQFATFLCFMRELLEFCLGCHYPPWGSFLLRKLPWRTDAS